MHVLVITASSNDNKIKWNWGEHIAKNGIEENRCEKMERGGRMII